MPRECTLGNDHPYQEHCHYANTFEEWKDLALTGWSYQEISPHILEISSAYAVENFQQDFSGATPTTVFTIYRRSSHSPALWREGIHIHLTWRRNTQSIQFYWQVQEEKLRETPTIVTMGLSHFDVQRQFAYEMRTSVTVFGRMLFDKFFSRYIDELSDYVDHPFAGRAFPDQVKHYLWE